ncbi:MAG: AMP-binding protein, partial [Actinomycetota bacterium]
MTVLSHAVGDTATPLLRETIGENLARTVDRHGDAEALVSRHQGIRWTYREFATEVDRVARALVAAGYTKGDRVGIWSPNNAEWVLIQYATAQVGVILVNINPAYRTHELEYALNQSGCRGLFAASRFKTSDYVAMVDEVRSSVPDLEHVVFVDSQDWSDFLSGAESVQSPVIAEIGATLDPDDPINIQYTSGTTGYPKGATLSHVNILNNGFFVGETCRYTEADRVCIPVPLYHCFGMVLGNLAITTHGATMVFPSDAFEARTTLEAVSEERCTSLYGVPTMFIAELAEPDFESYDLSTLRT